MGGRLMHQHGALSPAAMAQPNGAPQRAQLLDMEGVIGFVITGPPRNYNLKSL